MNSEISVNVGVARLENGAAAMSVKIQTNIFELNIWILEKDLPRLKQLDELDSSIDCCSWLQIGRSANSDVFWSKDATEVSILVGHDRESWDVGVTLPHLALRQILDGVHATKLNL